MLTYSYCNQTDTCLEDSWNYVARPCADGWKRGRSYSYEYCEPNEALCPEFKSSTEKFQLNTTSEQTLKKGEFCTVKIDATEALARVVFEDDSDSLGIEFDGAKIGQPITFESGQNEIVIFNGKQTASGLTFEIVFSGASALSATAAAALALSAAYF